MNVEVVTLTKADLQEIAELAARKAVDAMPKPKRYLTITQLAEHWQVSKQSIRNWMTQDIDPLPVHYVGSDPRFDQDELSEWSRRVV